MRMRLGLLLVLLNYTCKGNNSNEFFQNFYLDFILSKYDIIQLFELEPYHKIQQEWNSKTHKYNGTSIKYLQSSGGSKEMIMDFVNSKDYDSNNVCVMSGKKTL